MGGSFTLGVEIVVQTSSSLFNLDGVRTIIVLIKKEGLVTPLTTIYLVINLSSKNKFKPYLLYSVRSRSYSNVIE